MEKAWVNDSATARFWRQLHNDCVDKLVNDPKQYLLKHMRHDYAMVREYQSRFGHIFRERGLNLYELIARACGEVWDNEDEEKGGVRHREKIAPIGVKEEHAVSLDPAREVGVRERQVQGDVVQAGNGRREIQLQEGGRRKAGGSAQEAAAEKKKQVEAGGGVKPHTKGLGNTEEGRLAEGLKPKKKQRKRKRPTLGQAFKLQN
jgi:phage anti-repressor protein